ncbi:MAG: hypothetical protein R2862_03430 [Thermoanaerobaculia bacterium]
MEHRSAGGLRGGAPLRPLHDPDGGALFLLLYRALCARSGAWAAATVATAASATLVLDPYFLYWGLSGMENSLLSALVLAAILGLAAGRPRLSLLCAALLPLVRFDGLVPALVLAGFHVGRRLAADRRTPLALRIRRQLPAMAAMFGLTLAPFLAGLAFRILYYGERVPNTAWPKFLLRLPADRFAEGSRTSGTPSGRRSRSCISSRSPSSRRGGACGGTP